MSGKEKEVGIDKNGQREEYNDHEPLEFGPIGVGPDVGVQAVQIENNWEDRGEQQEAAKVIVAAFGEDVLRAAGPLIADPEYRRDGKRHPHGAMNHHEIGEHPWGNFPKTDLSGGSYHRRTKAKLVISISTGVENFTKGCSLLKAKFWNEATATISAPPGRNLKAC
jgi:hypothetical protein